MRFQVSLGLVLLLTTAAAAQVPPSDHVVVVVEENHSYEDVIFNPAMPFFNQLAAQYGLATQYFANAHPSAPNYFMLTAGQLFTMTDTITGQVTDDNIVRELLAAGKTWRAYAQSLPAAGYLGPDVPPYVAHHNPFVFFSDVQAGAQLDNIVPLTQLTLDLAAGQLANYSFIIPDVRHDGHECKLAKQAGCDDTARLTAADEMLQSTLTPLLQDPIFQPGGDGLLIVVFDESFPQDIQGGGGHVAAIVVGPNVIPGMQSPVPHQHQDTLRLCAEALGLPASPGLAATATDMSEFFPPAAAGVSPGPAPAPSPSSGSLPDPSPPAKSGGSDIPRSIGR